MDGDTVMDHVVKWSYRFGLAWCVVGTILWAWRGNLFWVGWYVTWFAFTFWSTGYADEEVDDR